MPEFDTGTAEEVVEWLREKEHVHQAMVVSQSAVHVVLKREMFDSTQNLGGVLFNAHGWVMGSHRAQKTGTEMTLVDSSEVLE